MGRASAGCWRPKGGAGSLGSYGTSDVGCACTRWPPARCMSCSLARLGRSACLLRDQGLPNLTAVLAPSWRRAAVASAITEHASELILRARAERTAALPLPRHPDSTARDGTCDEPGMACVAHYRAQLGRDHRKSSPWLGDRPSGCRLRRPSAADQPAGVRTPRWTPACADVPQSGGSGEP